MKLTPFNLTRLPSGRPVKAPLWDGTFEYHVGPSKHNSRRQMDRDGFQEVFPSSGGKHGTMFVEGKIPVWNDYGGRQQDGLFVFIESQTWILRSSYVTSESMCVLLERPRPTLAKWIRLARRANTAEKRAKFYRKARKLVGELS